MSYEQRDKSYPDSVNGEYSFPQHENNREITVNPVESERREFEKGTNVNSLPNFDTNLREFFHSSGDITPRRQLYGNRQLFPDRSIEISDRRNDTNVELNVSTRQNDIILQSPSFDVDEPNHVTGAKSNNTVNKNDCSVRSEPSGALSVQFEAVRVERGRNPTNQCRENYSEARFYSEKLSDLTGTLNRVEAGARTQP